MEVGWYHDTRKLSLITLATFAICIIDFDA
jgi:hypothetical protein